MDISVDVLEDSEGYSVKRVSNNTTVNVIFLRGQDHKGLFEF